MICFLSNGKFCCFFMEKHSIYKQKAEFNFLSDEWAQEAPGREGSTWTCTSRRREPVQWKLQKDTWWEEVKKEKGRPGLPFVSPRPAWPMAHSPDLLSPTSACCNYYRDVIHISKILTTQDCKQVAVWTQCPWSEELTTQSNITHSWKTKLVVRKVGVVVQERLSQNFILKNSLHLCSAYSGKSDGCDQQEQIKALVWAKSLSLNPSVM